MSGLAISTDCIPTGLRAGQLWQTAQQGPDQRTTIPKGRAAMEDTKDTSSDRLSSHPSCLGLHKITSTSFLPSAFTSKLYYFTTTKWDLFCCSATAIQTRSRKFHRRCRIILISSFFLTFHWFCFCNIGIKHHEYSNSLNLKLSFHMHC